MKKQLLLLALVASAAAAAAPVDDVFDLKFERVGFPAAKKLAYHVAANGRFTRTTVQSIHQNPGTQTEVCDLSSSAMRRLSAKLAVLRVREWEATYSDMGLEDGYRWELRLIRNGVESVHSGRNAGPAFYDPRETAKPLDNRITADVALLEFLDEIWTSCCQAAKKH